MIISPVKGFIVKHPNLNVEFNLIKYRLIKCLNVAGETFIGSMFKYVSLATNSIFFSLSHISN